MIRLDSTSEKIEIVLGAGKTTNDCSYFSSYYDVPRQQIPGYIEFPGGNSYGNTNGTSAVTLTPSPNQSTVRNIEYISITNNDTVTTTVTIRINNGVTTYNLLTVSLNTLESIVFTNDGNGWSVI